MSKKETKCENTDMRDLELKLLIIEYNRASQLDRSFASIELSQEDKKKFRKKLLNSCFSLIKKVDEGILENQVIRDAIEELTKIGPNKRISFGQAQKVINVVLKQYCFITNKGNKQLRELDCPLDKTTMEVDSKIKKEHGIKHKQLKNVNIEDYKGYQNIFENEHGMKILRDCKYDRDRICEFLKSETKTK